MSVHRKKLLSLVVATSFSLGVAEMFLRSFSSCPVAGYRNIAPLETLFQYDPSLGWRGRPNASHRLKGYDFDVLVNHDRHGYRNLSDPSGAGKGNILVLGDSYGWGWGVQDDQVFSTLAMKMDDRLNLYNLSIPTYGTDQEYLTLVTFLRENDPYPFDGVILLFYVNDFDDVGGIEGSSYPKSKFVIENDKLSLVNTPVPERKNEDFDRPTRREVRIENRFLFRFHFHNLVRRRGVEWVKGNRNGTEVEISRSLRSDPTPVEKNNLDVTCMLFSKIASLCKRSDMFVHVVVLMTIKTDAKRWEWQPLDIVFNAENIGCSRFHSRRLPSTDLWCDGHFSKYGNKLLARDIVSTVQQWK